MGRYSEGAYLLEVAAQLRRGLEQRDTLLARLGLGLGLGLERLEGLGLEGWEG